MRTRVQILCRAGGSGVSLPKTVYCSVVHSDTWSNRKTTFVMRNSFYMIWTKKAQDERKEITKLRLKKSSFPYWLGNLQRGTEYRLWNPASTRECLTMYATHELYTCLFRIHFAALLVQMTARHAPWTSSPSSLLSSISCVRQQLSFSFYPIRPSAGYCPFTGKKTAFLFRCFYYGLVQKN